MTIKRLWQTLRMMTIRGSYARTDYLRKRHVYGAIGDNCSIQKRSIPLYANLIRLGNNVHIASNVSFLTHDVTHSVLNRLEDVKRAGGVQEQVGCIEIGNNVFIGSGTHIMRDTRIGSNVIIGTCSVVTHDIPDNSVAAGVPARIIGTFDDYVSKCLAGERYPEKLRPRKQTASEELADYLWKRFEAAHKSV